MIQSEMRKRPCKSETKRYKRSHALCCVCCVHWQTLERKKNCQRISTVISDDMIRIVCAVCCSAHLSSRASRHFRSKHTLTFYTFIVVLIIFLQFFFRSLTRHDHLSHTLFDFFFAVARCTLNNKSNKMHFDQAKGWCATLNITQKLEHIHRNERQLDRKISQLNYFDKYNCSGRNAIKLKRKRARASENSFQKSKRSFPLCSLLSHWKHCFCVWILFHNHTRFFFLAFLWFIFANLHVKQESRSGRGRKKERW